MRIRWKLLILLLVVALVPVGLITLRATRGTYRMGREIGDRTRAALIDRAEERLELYIEDKAELMRRATDFVLMALHWQADQVERALASPPQEGQKVYFAPDFRDPAKAPPDLAVSDRFIRVSEESGAVGMEVSHGHQVFFLARDADANQCMPDVRRLSSMSEVYRRIAQHDVGTGLIFWQYTGLENGLYSSYPGAGAFPDDYDHRRRAWYQRAKARDGLVWMPPYIDMNSRLTVLSAMMPVHRPDGSFAGVTAIDVTRADLMKDATPAGFESAVARLTLLMPRQEFDRLNPPLVDPDSIDPNRAGLYIVAVSEPARARELDTRPFEGTWLESADQGEFLAVLHDMKAGRSGVREMEYEGRRCLWAYGKIDKPYLVAVVPYEDVIVEANEAQAVVMKLTQAQLTVTAWICAALVVVLLLVAFFGSRVVTTPVRLLAEGADRIAGGDFEARVEVRTRDELGRLGRTFNEMVPKLRDQVRMRASLTVAMEVQQSLLPSEPPQVEGFDIAGRSLYCDETGGDYYDFLDLSPITPHTLGIALGDVTGHGIAAALLMATARGLLRSRADQPGSLGDLLNHVNAHLAKDVPPGKFMTLSFLLLDSRTKTTRWASAGHDPAIIYTPSTDLFAELAGGGLPLGIEGGWQYEEFGPRALEPGQVILVGTDGIWEAHDDSGQMFGMDRLRQIIRDKHDQPAAKISQCVTSAVSLFQGEHLQEDDITLVVVKVLP